MGFGVGTLIPNDIKNVFREDFSNHSLKLLWNEIEIQGQQVPIGNVYIPPKHEISPAPIEQFDLILLRRNLVLLGDLILETKYGTKTQQETQEWVTYLRTQLISTIFSF